MNKSKLVSVKNLKNLPPKYKVRVYYGSKEPTHHLGGKTVKKSRMDRLEDSIASLAKTVEDGFAELRQDVKDINTRLDYIVKANNLKDNK